jgi:hypothetical protein
VENFGAAIICTASGGALAPEIPPASIASGPSTIGESDVRLPVRTDRSLVTVATTVGGTGQDAVFGEVSHDPFVTAAAEPVQRVLGAGRPGHLERRLTDIVTLPRGVAVMAPADVAKLIIGRVVAGRAWDPQLAVVIAMGKGHDAKLGR